MSLKEDRMFEVMKERIAQLESELELRKHHLNEAITHKESLETEIDALRNEAHDVVSQWAEKSKGLQSSLDELTSRYQDKEKDLESHQSRIKCLERILHDAEVTNVQRSDELKRIKEDYDELSKRATTAESDWCAASQRIMKYESLVNKMDVELKQNIDDIQLLTIDKSRLLENIASFGEEKKHLELTIHEYKGTVMSLKDKIVFLQNEKQQLALAEVERRVRDEIFFVSELSLRYLLLKELKDQLISFTALQTRCSEMELTEASLRQEQIHFRKEIIALREKNISLEAEYETKNSELSKKVTLLQNDISELQDSQIGRTRLVKSLQEEIDIANLRFCAIETSKEGLEAELKVVRECCSSLLIENSDLKEQSQKAQEQLKERVGQLEEEKTILERNLMTRLSAITAQNEELHEMIRTSERIYHQEVEDKERWRMQVDLYESLLLFIPNFHTEVAFKYCQTLTLLKDTQKDLGVSDSLVTEKMSEICDLNKKLKIADLKLAEKSSAVTVLESKCSQGALELEKNMRALTDTINDNNWLKEQVESMRRELGELDELLNANLNEMREENERYQIENARLFSETVRLAELNKKLEGQIAVFEERCEILLAENTAISKTLSLTEADLERMKEENLISKEHEKTVLEQKRALESKISLLQKEHGTIDSQTSVLKEKLRKQEERLQFMSASGRQEVETMKNKVNSYIEKYEASEKKLMQLSKAYQESEGSLLASREAYNKTKIALEEVKQRCCKDSETIQKLLLERDSAMKERELIVEKYNRIHDLLKEAKKENHGKLHDEVHRLAELCAQQEVELQQLRHQNIMLKKGIVKISDGSLGQTDRPVFLERLNLTEGPLRYPRKRAAASTEVNRSQ